MRLAGGKMKIIVLVLAAVWGCASYAGPDLSDIHQYRKFLTDVMNDRYDFRLEGEVVDEEGKPLTGLKATLATSDDPMLAPQRRSVEVPDGHFCFKSPSVLGFECEFIEPGYYAESIGIGKNSIGKEVKDGKAFVDGNTIVKKVRVVLISHGPPFNRKMADQPVIFYGQKNAEGEVFITGNRVILRPGFVSAEPLKQVYASDRELPPDGFWLLPQIKADGSWGEQFVLKTTYPDSGFIQVEYTGKNCFRKVYEAPVDGYSPEIALTLPDLSHGPGVFEYLVFYLKMGDCYGKVFFYWCRASVQPDYFSVDCMIYISRVPNERNVNTNISTPL